MTTFVIYKSLVHKMSEKKQENAQKNFHIPSLHIQIACLFLANI